VQVRLVRYFRRILLGVIVMLLAAVAVNYCLIWRSRGRPVAQVPDILAPDLLRAARDIEYTERRSGKIQFKLQAERLRETRGGKILLDGIQAFDLNPDGSTRNLILSRQAEYDRQAKHAVFEGDVRIRMGDTVWLKTDSLDYDMSSGVGQTEDRIAIEAPEVRGSALGMRYATPSRELELRGSLDFTVRRVQIDPSGSAQEESYAINSERGYYFGENRQFRFEGHTRLESQDGRIVAEMVEAQLSPDETKLLWLHCFGDASYESRSEAGDATLRGERMYIDLGDTAPIRRIEVGGNAGLVQTSAVGGQDLRAERIVLSFDPSLHLPNAIESNGKVLLVIDDESGKTLMRGERLESAFGGGGRYLESVVVSEDSSISFLTPSGKPGEQLFADEIRLSFGQVEGTSVLKEIAAERSVSWSSTSLSAPVASSAAYARKVEAQSLRLIYSQGTNELEAGRAAGNVVISVLDLGHPDNSTTRKMSCREADVYFHPGGKALKTLQSRGNVEVYVRTAADPEHGSAAAGEFHTSSDYLSAIFRESDGAAERISQWGNFRYRDAYRRASADRCDYQAAQEVLTLSGFPQVIDQNGTTGGAEMQYWQGREILQVKGMVRTVLAAGGDVARNLGAGPSNSSSPTIITAEELEYLTSGGRASYQGNVQLLSERGQLCASKLGIEGDGSLMTATGGVQHTIFSPNRSAEEPTLITSSALQYSTGSQAIVYQGSVTLKTKDMQMSSDVLEGLVDPEAGRIRRALAQGKIRIMQGGRVAEGDAAEYMLDPGVVVVTGQPAKISDPARGRSLARRLTFYMADDRILLENP